MFRVESNAELHSKLKESIHKYLDILEPFPAPSGKEDIIKSICESGLLMSGFEIHKSLGNNVIATRGKTDKYPVLNAHLDHVNSSDFIEHITIEVDDDIRKNVGKYCTGYDDKAGIALIFAIADNSTFPFKVILTSNEETCGFSTEGYSVYNIPRRVYDDARCCFVLDRMGREDIISEYLFRKIASEEFVNSIIAKSEEIGTPYVESDGTYSDAYVIGNYIDTVNLSVGYYYPHSIDEFVDVSATANTGVLVIRMCESYESDAQKSI